MTTKVTIPREVADAIEGIRSRPENDTRYIIGRVLSTIGGDITTSTVAALRSIPFDTLLSALVNGYERELTEEEQKLTEIRARYEQHREGAGDYDYSYADKAHADGIEWTLDTLGIDIPGVNAPEETEVSAHA